MTIADRLRLDAGVELILLLTRTRPLPLFLGAIAFDLLRLGQRGFREAAGMFVRRQLKITTRSIDDDHVLEFLRELAPDVGLHATPVIYRTPLIECFRLGILNPHIGLLPKYRGRSVLEWSILEGDPTGITTFFIDEGIDTGAEIVLRKEVPVTGFANVAAAKQYLFSLSGDMFRAAMQTLREPGFTPLRQTMDEGTRWYVMSRLLTGVVDRILAESARAER
jgi:methionyl-tRNA formyltransferase